MKKVLKSVGGFLNQGFANIKIYEALAGVVIALLFVIIGSNVDLSLSKNVVQPGNAFSIIINYLGSLPGYALLGAVGIMFFVNYNPKSKKDSKILSILCAIVFPVLAGALYGYDCFYKQGIDNQILALLVGVLIVGAICVGIYFWTRNGDKEEAYRTGLALLVASVLILGLSFMLKRTGYRPRYLLILENNNDYSLYRDWWTFDTSVKETFMSLEKAPDEDLFHSWPSNHTAFSTLGIMFCLIARLNEKTKDKSYYFVYITYIFTMVVAFGRIFDGHHYLSDVAFGALYSCILVYLVIYLFELPKIKERTAEEIEERSKLTPMPDLEHQVIVYESHKSSKPKLRKSPFKTIERKTKTEKTKAYYQNRKY
ncbi:MAG: phosphatase PAP2 family protein [Bacilli bacterium]|nr:phosphatase PAP2 family protein [Bacilli bacterium]